jgi:hypothetical protein
VGRRRWGREAISSITSSPNKKRKCYMERPLDLALSREPSKFSINEVKRRMKKPEKEKKEKLQIQKKSNKSNSGDLLRLQRLVGGAPMSAASGGRGGLRVRGLGDPPWSPDLEGGPGAAAAPTVVVGCGRNSERRPPGWWRRPVGPGLVAGAMDQPWRGHMRQIRWRRGPGRRIR